MVILLTIMGLQWAVKENSSEVKENIKQEAENYMIIIPKYPLSPEKLHRELKIY